MNNKKLIRLTEADLHRIVKESVNKVLNEIDMNSFDIDDRTPQEITADERKDALYEKYLQKGYVVGKRLENGYYYYFTKSGMYGEPTFTLQKDPFAFGGVTVFLKLSMAQKIAQENDGKVFKFNEI